jgi:GDP-mannose 6-dehydrogenase
MKISVFGLGYVGAVSCACIADRGHDVVGVDINEEKVRMINAGKSPIIEEGLDDIIQRVTREGRLRATTNHLEALRFSEVSLVAVATPSTYNGGIDASHLLQVCTQIADSIGKLAKKQVVVIRSSVLPHVFNQCRDLFVARCPRLVELCANPEFLREASAVQDFDNPPQTIIGTSSTCAQEKLRELYASVNAPIVVMNPAEALLVKYASNAYHGLKVAFANEIGLLCKSMGLNGETVMRVFAQDTKLNISSKYLLPGFAFGGSCLPKDIRAMLYLANKSDVEVPLLNNILVSNKTVIENVTKKILSYARKKIALIGLSFKPNTDDLRESPLVDLAERLIGKGIDLRIYDPSLSMARLTGTNRDYIEKSIPHISRLLQSDPGDVIRGSEVLVFGHEYPEIMAMCKLQQPLDIVVDLTNISDLKAITKEYYGVGW